MISYQLAKMTNNRDYLHDFLVASSSEAKVPYLEYFELLQSSQSRDVEELSASFPDAKCQLEELNQNASPGDGASQIIQIVALNYIRKYLIPQVSQGNREHLKDVFALIMPFRPIDLDVLTDAYIEIAPLLNKDEQITYYAYLVDVYREQSITAKARFIKAKHDYENVSTDRERFGAFIVGKRYECVLRSLRYSDKKLKLREALANHGQR